ncbi:hypothetical protein RQP46_003959 [Phenoliferia psychrophenolica]
MSPYQYHPLDTKERSPWSSPSESSSELPMPGAGLAKERPRFATRRLLYLFVVLEAALLVLACIGGVYLVRLHLTGTLYAVPDYTAQEVRDAGWMRPLAILDTPSSQLPPPNSHSSSSSSSAATGQVEMFNLSSHPATASSLHLLVLTPLANSAKNLPRLFAHLDSFKHPRVNTSLGFLVGDEEDSTGVDLRELVEARKHEYRKISILAHNSGLELPRGEGRHLRSVQRNRRSLLGKARSVLLMSTLQGDHDWVLWLDSDVSEVPPTLFEDLLRLGNTGVGIEPTSHDYDPEFNDIVSPNICMRREGKISGYDMNNWIETPESLKKKAKMSQDQLLVEGGPSRFDTKRTHLTELRVPPNASWDDSGLLAKSNLYDPKSDAYVGRRVQLDGVGGVATLVRAQAHRLGAVFPGWIVDHQLETEGFAVIARQLGARIVGLPNYVVVHG